jgi:hypothetical protein
MRRLGYRMSTTARVVVCATVDGVSGVVVEYAYVGDTLVAERRGNEWIPMVYGLRTCCSVVV